MQQKVSRLIEEHNIHFGELAQKLNVSKQTLTRKLNGSTDWTYAEIVILTELFNIKDPQSFFFDIK
jgi:plasmid maintenance system antidote protein VapI